jgi:hypothetical protein
MAVLKDNPFTCFLTLLNHLLSNRTLTLTQGDRLYLFFLDAANELNEANGSEPGLKMNIKGEVEVESV